MATRLKKVKLRPRRRVARFYDKRADVYFDVWRDLKTRELGCGCLPFLAKQTCEHVRRVRQASINVMFARRREVEVRA